MHGHHIADADPGDCGADRGDEPGGLTSMMALDPDVRTGNAVPGQLADGPGQRPGCSRARPAAPGRDREYQDPVATAPAADEEKLMRADIIPGGTFPDYELTDHTKARRRLSELQGIDPMILVLSRGGFCPKDHQQHLELAANYPKIRVAYTQIVTISTDNVLKSNEFRDSVGAQWTFLSDAGRKIAKDLDIAEYTDSYYDPMIPYTLVLKPGLVIYSVYNGYWFWGRPSFEDLRRDLREVTREIRPDWDLAVPGLRENWESGDHSMHHLI
jgi:peroxiredoxin